MPDDIENVLTKVRTNVRHYQAGILLDTNMALLHLLYKALGTEALSCGLVKVYTEGHVAVLDSAISVAEHVSVTPHVLTEVDYFIRDRLETRRGRRTYEVLQHLAKGWCEPVRPGRELLADELAFAVGVADLSQATLRKRRRLMITDDMRLMNIMEGRNIPYLNPAHYVW